jgi:hypothetical protein
MSSLHQASHNRYDYQYSLLLNLLLNWQSTISLYITIRHIRLVISFKFTLLA